MKNNRRILHLIDNDTSSGNIKGSGQSANDLLILIIEERKVIIDYTESYVDQNRVRIDTPATRQIEPIHAIQTSSWTVNASRTR